MDKKNYFKGKDVNIFINMTLDFQPMEQKLRKTFSKIDLSLTNNNVTFLQAIIYALNKKSKTFELDISFIIPKVFKNLDILAYPYQYNDFKTEEYFHTFDSKEANIWKGFFEHMKERGFHIQNISYYIKNTFSHVKNEEFIDYLQSQNVDIKFDYIVLLVKDISSKDHNIEEVFDKSDNRKTFEKNYIQNMNYLQQILNYIHVTPLSRHQINVLTEACFPSPYKFQQYITEHNIDLHIYGEYEYIKNKDLKPRQWYCDKQLIILDTLENQYNLQYLQNNIKPSFHI